MTLRWGIVTAGKIANDFANAFNSFPDKGDQTIAGVAARDKEKAREFAKVHGIPKVFGSYRAMATSNDIDVAYVAALNSDHYPLTKLFLDNGKHVLCEKPFCLNAKQAQSLINLARKNNLFLMEGVWSRFSPAYVDLEKDINSGKLGDIQFLEVNLGFYGEGDKIDKKECGGGAVLDVGVYALQLSQLVFNEEPVAVRAAGLLNQHGVDVSETIVLQYSGGRRAVMNLHTKLKLWNKATIYGTRGRITIEDSFHFPDKVTDVDGKVKTYTLHESSLPYNFNNSAGLVYETLEVARCIEAGLLESPRVTHKETLSVAKLQDEVRHQLGVHYDADDLQYP